MPVHLFSISGNTCIGIYSLATEKFAIIPPLINFKKIEKLEEVLKIKTIPTTIGSFILIGVLVCANSNGIILPHFVQEEEIKIIKKSFKGNITIMKTKKTAYGNMVLANDYGAIVDPTLEKKEINKISETLGVETLPGKIAGLTYVGSLGVATNKGCITHPLLKDSEKALLKEVLKVKVEVGTINRGIPYIGTGLISNTNAAVVGYLTTGPEIFIIGNVLDVVREE